MAVPEWSSNAASSINHSIALDGQLVEDTLGFSTMLKHFTFDFVLVPEGSSRTRVVNSSYFEPRNVLARIMIAFMIRKKFRAIRQTALANIKRLAEAAGSKD